MNRAPTIPLLLCLTALAGQAAPMPGSPAPALGQTTPAWTLPDAGGKTRALTGFRGRPAVLFFFCGCDACRRCASAWAEAQRSGALPPLRSVVVFSGDAATARRFCADTGLNPAQTTLLLDPTDRVAARYLAPVCPRAFALDAAGRLRYTNNEPGTNPQTMPAAALVSRLVSAVQKINAVQKVSTIPAAHAAARPGAGPAAAPP